VTPFDEYVPPRTVITDPAYQALQELNSLKLENLPRAVEGGTYQFVLKVCAVGPAEFAHYAAQLGLDVQQFSDPSAPLGILLNHTSLRQGGKLYDLDLFNLKPGDTMTVSKMSGYSSPQTGGEATPSLTWTVGAVAQEHPLGFMGTTLVQELIV
jgi:putative ABC transport system permease protein